MIGIVLPTRGLVFTRVEEAIEREKQNHQVRVYRSWDQPIPDGHNTLAKKALEDGCDYIWFIEEDTVPTTGALDRLLEADSPIACVDYGVAGWGCVTHNSEGEILWCGLGCTLVKKEVLEALDYPYFRADKVLRLNDWTWQQLPESYIEKKNYGSLDIWFCTKAREKGFSITQVEGECEHLELKALGQRQRNNGLHEIGLREKISKHQILKGGE
jgi:hypothetical protein